ncbi:MAG TPA: YkgJ family cysteine cluster protein [Streptosporangiaceae bacterium]|nr:YkgJ family cysteine cluster protein [Streptosporangiaceae bacterium]
MADWRDLADARLDDLYARVPAMPGCDGRCHLSCGPVEMSPRERGRIREAGITITPAAEAVALLPAFTCDALTPDNRCAVYGRRPMICRLWGAVEAMRCPFGCEPEGGYLTAAEGAELLRESLAAGGAEVPGGPSALPAGLRRSRTDGAVAAHG